jgi:hypothetical protein
MTCDKETGVTQTSKFLKPLKNKELGAFIDAIITNIIFINTAMTGSSIT